MNILEWEFHTMGLGSRLEIQAAANYLLGVLQHERIVCYSRFYDHRPGNRHALAQELLPFMARYAADTSFEGLTQHGHLTIEFAAWQLEDVGVVRITMLDSPLVDGERDFLIELTDVGEREVVQGLKFRFRELHYSVNAAPASRWLIDLLEVGSWSGFAECSLIDVMKTGESDGEVVIRDRWRNRYTLGTGSYAWAFEASMWHHARRGTITPIKQTDLHSPAWQEFVEKSYVPRPSIHKPQPLWAIPIRLSETRLKSPGRLHLGRILAWG